MFDTQPPNQVDELLPQGQSDIPQLSAALVTISRALDSEMAAMPAHEVCVCVCGFVGLCCTTECVKQVALSGWVWRGV